MDTVTKLIDTKYTVEHGYWYRINDTQLMRILGEQECQELFRVLNAFYPKSPTGRGDMVWDTIWGTNPIKGLVHRKHSITLRKHNRDGFIIATLH